MLFRFLLHTNIFIERSKYVIMLTNVTYTNIP